MTEETKKAEIKGRRTVVGRVISSKMDKTISVVVERLVKHPMYGKYVRRTTKILAHDENNECKSGDRVMLSECRPISKHKAWQVVNVVSRMPDQ